MRAPQPDHPSVETLSAALIYLLSRYAQTGCPRLAVCVARHLECLATHGDAAPVLRDTCAGLRGPWQQLAVPAARKAVH